MIEINSSSETNDIKIYLFLFLSFILNFLENSCTSDSLHGDVALSKENPTAKPNRSHIPVESIASFPVKVL